MEPQSGEIHVESNNARSGRTPHIVRYVLGISLFLAILALSAIWITGALSTDDQPAQTAPAPEVAPATP